MVIRSSSFWALALALTVMSCNQPAATEQPSESQIADPGPEIQTSVARPAPPAPPSEPLVIGSQDAKDDLYCGGLILASFPVPTSAMSPTDEARLIKNQNLGVGLADSGIDKLIHEGLAHATHAGVISDAYTAAALKDLDAGQPRISLTDCIARGEALPPVE